jgi:hypothetical protein
MTALNNGGIGASANAGGNGGANTGGGGGGSWTGTGAAGGSGIVVIAFPTGTTAVTSNQQAVLSSALVSSNLYNAVLNNATLSSASYKAFNGAYACRLINYNYFGPTVTLRYSTDTAGAYTANFYADICGNMGTGYLGTGQSVSSWLSSNSANTTYAFVVKWYDQGMDISFNSATQYTTTTQPIYDVANGVINFGYNGGTFGVNAPSTNYLLNLPATAFPLGDGSYTITIKHGYMNSLTNVGIWEGGATGGAAGSTNILITQSTYINDWWNGGVAAFGTPTANNVVTVKYTTGGGTNSHMGYINGTSYVLNTTSTRNQLSGSNFIGYSPGSASSNFNGQLYYMYINNNALSDSERQIIEATPYAFTSLPSMTLTISTLTTTNFAVTWTAVTNATTYAMYINGVVYGTVTSGQTITPGYNGPWTINVYAYNATYNLLASGYINSGSVTQSSIAISPNVAPSITLVSGYSMYQFTSTSSYTFTFNYKGTPTVYILAVGGGGGTSGDSGGGGGGGVVQTACTLASTYTSETITVTVGGGGAASTAGTNTTVKFTNNTALNVVSGTGIVAYGGGAGGTASSSAVGGSGGSGGGNGYSSTQTSAGQGTAGQGYNGGLTSTGNNQPGGGGGAGGPGGRGVDGQGTTGANVGGVGITYTINGYNTGWYFGGGGGGGSGGNQNGGNGGLGGGGGGGGNNTGYGGFTQIIAIGRTGGVNNAQTGSNGASDSTAYGGGAGGANTGGGAGGSVQGGHAGAAGGSGIVLLSFPTSILF